MTDLLYGAFGRDALLRNIQKLADRDYQHQVWGLRNFPPGVEYDDPSTVIHFLYDDTQIADDIAGMVGILLKHQGEVEAIKKLINKLDLALEEYDIGYVPVEEYIDASEWEEVVRAAKVALAVLTEG